jgi:hypothetical protein
LALTPWRQHSRAFPVTAKDLTARDAKTAIFEAVL